jgi:CRISPR-associated protein Cas8c/Csd1, subtype I-C/DVULG
MTILTSLVKAYDNLRDAPAFGYSQEKISYIIVLREDGSVAELLDCRDGEGKKAKPRGFMVPQAVKRTSGVAANFMWDKTSYVLGVDAQDPNTNEADAEALAKKATTVASHHKAFVEKHLLALGDKDDIGLQALKRFLENWVPEDFDRLGWPEEAKGTNVIFALESERLEGVNLHDRPAAKKLWAAISAAEDVEMRPCLVTGEYGVVARLHPSLKKVSGAQSSGASLVSFNLDSARSYGKEQGYNAPVSERAAFAYTTVLNRFLEKDSGHRIEIGEATTVFWADASERKFAQEAEEMFSLMFEAAEVEADIERVDTSRLRSRLQQIRDGLPLGDIEPGLAKGVRFHILGLSPNAARVSVRFHFSDTFGNLARNYQRFVSDMRIDPAPKGGYPPLWRYLNETAVVGKRENVNPVLSGEWSRSILSGSNYPLTLMSSVLTRIRADGDINPLRVGILKAVLVRNFKKENTPVALDHTNTNKGYLLGRLFAVYERIQTTALGRNVNATIKDKFYGSASAQPRRVFATLDSGSQNHLSKIGKDKPGYKVVLEKDIGSIMELMSPGGNPYPVSLSAEEQALFALGYYHQRNDYFKTKAEESVTEGE